MNRNVRTPSIRTPHAMPTAWQVDYASSKSENCDFIGSFRVFEKVNR